MLNKLKTSLLATSLVLLSPNVLAEECEFFEGLSYYQKEVAYQAFRAGEPHDLGFTMIAIAWKESKLGLYKVRYGYTELDRSYGVMHTVAHWKTKDMTPFKKGRWVQGVIQNDVLSLQIGLSDLLYWKERNEGDWFKMVGSYNGGSIPNNTYAEDVVSIVKEVKLCNI